MNILIKKISQCNVCKDHLPFGCNPVVQLSAFSKIVIIGQAPGRKVHESGIPWNDQSGVTLRSWLNVNEDSFYDPDLFSIMPMGFCYPGKAISGDLPPRRECAPLWHPQLLTKFKTKPLFLLIGQYAQSYYLKRSADFNLTVTVKKYASFLPDYFPLPHPSPRNQNWLKLNPWFLEETIPVLQKKIECLIRPERIIRASRMSNSNNDEKFFQC